MDLYYEYYAVWKPFELLFIVRKNSAYRNTWSFRTTYQVEALRAVGGDYEKHAYDIESAECSVLLTNPLHLEDIYFAGVQLMGKDYIYCCVHAAIICCTCDRST